MNKEYLQKSITYLTLDIRKRSVHINKLKEELQDLENELSMCKKQLNKILEKEFVEQKLKELKQKYPNGYTIYKYKLETGYCGSNQNGYFVRSKNYLYEKRFD